MTPDYTIHTGDALATLVAMSDQSANCCVTSPPYYGLRDYGVEGQLGLEPTPEEYVAAMVAVFREVQRVLRDDGTLWLNIGDSYATGAGKVGACPGGGSQGEQWSGNRGDRPGSPKHSAGAMGPTTQPNRLPLPGLKAKDLIGIPWRLAFALQADGWYLRQDIIWAKPNPMPESVTDRCTKAHEYLFLMSKSPRYYYDHEAIKEPAGGWNGSEFHVGQTMIHQGNRASRKQRIPAGWATGPGSHGSYHRDGRAQEVEYTEITSRSGNKARKPSEERGCPADSGSNVCGSVPWEGNTRNKRSVWMVATHPYPEAHFATYPPALIEPCILAGCPPDGLVLDPFTGSGTTGEVALRLGRRFVGIELNPAYVELAERRIGKAAQQLTLPI